MEVFTVQHSGMTEMKQHKPYPKGTPDLFRLPELVIQSTELHEALAALASGKGPGIQETRGKCVNECIHEML
jgi:hypothetical protein